MRVHQHRHQRFRQGVPAVCVSSFSILLFTKRRVHKRPTPGESAATSPSTRLKYGCSMPSPIKETQTQEINRIDARTHNAINDVLLNELCMGLVGIIRIKTDLRCGRFALVCTTAFVCFSFCKEEAADRRLRCAAATGVRCRDLSLRKE